MRVLIDTNVLINYLGERQPFFDFAWRIISACDAGELDGCISAQSIADMFYILRKDMSESDRRRVLLALCDMFTVESINQRQIIEALKNDVFSDFEDCLQSCCASAFHADYVITRNGKDFSASIIPAISPDAFCTRFLISGGCNENKVLR